MAYLTEHAVKKEKITVLNGDTHSLTDAKSTPNKQADDTNTEISRNLKRQRQSLIHLLSEFPATAVWLLRKYQQQGLVEHQDDEITSGLKSDLAYVLNNIKAHYLALADNLDNARVSTAAKLKLTAALREFPFSFDEVTQLIDLLAYTFKLRALAFPPKKPTPKDAVRQRLEGSNRPNRLHKKRIIEFFDDIGADGCDIQTLFLSAKVMADLFPLIAESEQEWLSSRQKLAQANNKLVLFIANQYKACFLDFEDLVQEGQTGLLKAVDRFDPELGFQFSTYAGYWIRQAISRSLSRCERVVRIPCGQVATINKVYRCKEELTNKTGMEPNALQLADYTGLSIDEVNTILSISQSPVSLENTSDDESAFSPIDYLEQHIFTHPMKDMAENDLEQLLKTAISTLTPREIQVVRSHFGLNGEPEMTLQEIGSKLNLTRERIRQIQVTALNKIKTHFGDDLLCFL